MITVRAGTARRAASLTAADAAPGDSAGRRRLSVDRASPADMMQLATDVGPAPMHVGAVLVLGTGPAFSVATAERLIGERIRAVPRLRQRLYRAPPGCGRPFWADDPLFDLRSHVRQRTCPPPGDLQALLAVATTVIGEPLPRSRPLWSATFVIGLAGGRTGLIIVMNHVLADGIGGLAVLRALVDEDPGATSPPQPARPFPVPPPRPAAVAADAWASRIRGLAGLAGSLRTVRHGVAELGIAGRPRTRALSSLNQPTGRRRRLDVVSADLAAVRHLGHACGGTVNDVFLAAVTGALRTLLADRGEAMDFVTVSVPVSARHRATPGELGNQVGTMPLVLPSGGTLAERTTRTAAITRDRKATAHGTSAAVLGPAFRLLAAAGLLRWFANRQRLVHTFATNLRGPGQPLTFAGAPVDTVIPIPSTTGNVTITFAALSYAGTLLITVLSDPDPVPDIDVLTGALRDELDGL